MRARDEYRKAVAEALTDWRLGCIPPQPDSSFERAIVVAGLAEILRLRLEIAYTPLLQGLRRIENRIDILANIRENPYAPPPERPEQDKIQTRSFRASTASEAIPHGR